MSKSISKINQLNISNVINWFPGHMASAMNQISNYIKKVDLVVEVRDARIPFSSANHQLEEMARNKKRLIVFTKADLTNSNLARKAAQRITETCSHQCLFVNASTGARAKEVLAWSTQMARQEFKTGGTMLMVVGMPNVGKSSLINQLKLIRKHQEAKSRSKAPVGPNPGVTRRTDIYRISGTPAVYLVDTPGVMIPRIPDMETGMKLVLARAIPDHLVGYEVLAEYIIRFLFERKAKIAFDNLGIDPTDDIDIILSIFKSNHALSANQNGRDAAAKRFVDTFRNGDLGKFVWDEIC